MRERLLTAEELNQLLIDTIKLIAGDERSLPKTEVYKGFSDLRIEIQPHGYEYIYSEKGEEVFRKLALDLNDLLYMVFTDITRTMAWSLKYNPDNNEEDSNTFRLNKQLELLARLSPQWAERKRRI